MPSLEDLRAQLITQLEGMVKRTGMYAPAAGEASSMLRVVTWTLAYIDDRVDEYAAARSTRSSESFGPLGPWCIEDWFTEPGGSRAAAQVVSYEAELLAQFGWLQVQRMSASQWKLFKSTIKGYRDRDVTRAEIETALPPPSLVVDGRVYCYAPVNGNDWVALDVYDPRHPPWRSPEALLRCARSSRGWMKDKMVVTPFGRTQLV